MKTPLYHRDPDNLIMKTILLIVTLAVLAGCKPLKYEDLKAREKWCADHAMRPDYTYFNATRGNPSGSNQVTSVRCVNELGQSFDPSIQDSK